jgi:hypothetical protein
MTPKHFKDAYIAFRVELTLLQAPAWLALAYLLRQETWWLWVVLFWWALFNGVMCSIAGQFGKDVFGPRLKDEP